MPLVLGLRCLVSSMGCKAGVGGSSALSLTWDFAYLQAEQVTGENAGRWPEIPESGLAFAIADRQGWQVPC